MAEGILGLAGGGSASLSNEVIDKLKAADRKASVEPIEKALEDWDLELEKIAEVEAKVLELYDAVKPFDLFNSGANIFEQMAASSSGTAAVFDAVDVANLIPGTINVSITQLAQKDVFQSDAVNEATKDTALGAETLTIQVGSDTAIDIDTDGKTYEELVDEINLYVTVSASLEEVGTDSYRLVIKSTESGLDNALTITGTASQTLGYTSDGTTEVAANHTVNALNLIAEIDSVDYNVSSNSITTAGGLTISAIELGDASVSIQKDTSSIIGGVETLVTAYNELVDIIDEESFSADSPLQDVASLKMMMSAIKEMLFSDYNTADLDSSTDQNIFNAGFTLDKTGHITIDTEVLGTAINDDFEGVKALFLGSAEDKGFGTALKEYIDDIKGYDGLLTLYGDNMTEDKIVLEEEKTDAIDDLDAKYQQMAQRFASYGTIIAQMEASFGGLKMMIAESVAS
jgi:flagellar hook-associated protein 2